MIDYEVSQVDVCRWRTRTSLIRTPHTAKYVRLIPNSYNHSESIGNVLKGPIL